jgi:hypothetical protein
MRMWSLRGLLVHHGPLASLGGPPDVYQAPLPASPEALCAFLPTSVLFPAIYAKVGAASSHRVSDSLAAAASQAGPVLLPELGAA